MVNHSDDVVLMVRRNPYIGLVVLVYCLLRKLYHEAELTCTGVREDRQTDGCENVNHFFYKEELVYDCLVILMVFPSLFLCISQSEVLVLVLQLLFVKFIFFNIGYSFPR